MRRLPLPALPVTPVIQACVRSITDPLLATGLTAALPLIAQAEAEYLVRGAAGTLYAMPESDTVGGWVSQADMSRVYTGTFARKGSPVRVSHYDVLKAAAPYATCPACAQRTISTLDHYLAKQHHPALAITPVNLVPNCADCNKTKAAAGADAPGDQLLHPYFDDVEDGVWLKASVLPGDPPSLVFRAEPPDHWHEVRRHRVVAHFTALKLNELYIAHAARLIADIGYRLNALHDLGGSATVSAHLAEEAQTRRQRATNSWQIASYAAMSLSPEFCALRHT
jgi:hypothetical protein